MKYKKQFSFLVFSILLSALSITSCKKLVQVDPPKTTLTQNNTYSSDGTTIAVMTGLYTDMTYSSIFSGNNSISFNCGLSSDELGLWSGANTLKPQSNYYQNQLSQNGSTNYGAEFWPELYRYLYFCNATIEGLTNQSLSANLTGTVRKQILGEAKFMRAFYYFYLVNLYGDVPLILGTDYNINALLPRSPKDLVWKQIITDLKDAQGLLSSNFPDVTISSTGSIERVRPTTWAATALLARAYLYTKNWNGADSAASVLINNSPTFSLSTLNNTFLKASLGNKEAIWQLQSTGLNPPTLINTLDAYYFIIPSYGPNSDQCFNISNTLLNSFEAGDNRKTNWIGVYGSGINAIYYPFKYKLGLVDPPVGSNEFTMVLRLGEQYLIRAEARAQLGNTAGAQADLNMIRARAGLGSITPTGTALMDAIMHERQVELFSEWGHRWLDLKRTGQVDAVMSVQTPLKGGVWNTNQQLYPISYSDILADPNLTQNPGY